MTEPSVYADVVAERLGVPRDSKRARIAKQDMPAHQVGRLWSVQANEVDDRGRNPGANETVKPAKQRTC